VQFAFDIRLTCQQMIENRTNRRPDPESLPKARSLALGLTMFAASQLVEQFLSQKSEVRGQMSEVGCQITRGIIYPTTSTHSNQPGLCSGHLFRWLFNMRSTCSGISPSALKR
jgi:hypothetical protein